MKFAHFADCHLGGWRDQKLRDANNKAFCMAIDVCLRERVDFVIIAGDLFNAAIPSIDCIRLAVEKLKVLKDAGIAVYGIPGSHDFSPSGKTMLDVLESAGLFINVAKGEEKNGKLGLRFTKDEKTGVQLTGIFGRAGGLDRYYYEGLARDQLHAEGFKIFAFHATLSELKPSDLEEMDAMSVSLLPKDFDYYAGGHVHVVNAATLDGYKNIVFPGPTFPNNIAELEKLRAGSMTMFDHGIIKSIVLEPFVVHSIHLEVTGKTSAEVEELIKSEAARSPSGAIVTLRIEGVLRQSKVSDVNWQNTMSFFSHAYTVVRNTAKLSSEKFSEVKVQEGSVDSIEERVIQENTGQYAGLSVEKERELLKQLLLILSVEKDEGMKRVEFENVITDDVRKVFSEQ